MLCEFSRVVTVKRLLWIKWFLGTKSWGYVWCSWPFPSGGTIHPSVLQTPPQAGVEIVRHTTPENIRKFFDPATYRKPRDMVSTCDPCSSPTNCQKRSPPSEASSAVAKAPKTLGKDELLEKFKLAATLNGIDWGDLAVSRLCKSLYMFF